MKLCKPIKTVAPVAEALHWRGGEHQLTRKYDGIFQTVQTPRFLIVGELVRPKSGGIFTAGDRELLRRHGGFFAAVTIAGADGADLTRESTRTRWGALRGALEDGGWRMEDGTPIVLAESGAGGEFVRRVLDAGGEGVCAVEWAAPWGAILAVKPVLTFRVVVTGFCGGVQSVEIADADTGQPRGKVSLRGGKVDKVRAVTATSPGSVLKVEALGLTDAGLLREPRVCQDAPGSWLVKF